MTEPARQGSIERQAAAPSSVRAAGGESRSPQARGIEDALAARFLRYSAIPSQSDASRTEVPTSEGQRELARLLADELAAAGARDVHLSARSVLTARIPATAPELPTIGFCTHLDTADAGLSPVVRARVVEYGGGDLVQDGAGARAICLAEHPELERYAGQRILVSDGTSVLGADDKAGVSTVMELACRLLTADGAGPGGSGEDADPVGGWESEPHGEIVLAFVPDEEIGLRGVRTIEPGRFAVDWAYTLDSCEIGEVVEETFNAATCTVTIEGVSAHPMSAKGVLVNPILIAAEIIARLDPAQTPERTEGREGYTWVHDIRGGQSSCVLTISVRDHDRARYEDRKAGLRAIVEEVAAAHPRASASLEIDDVYANLADARTPDNEVALLNVHRALERLGIPAIPLAMRGGTDGSWLSTQGVFTPNVFTGAHNFHSAAEFLPLPSFAASLDVCRELVRLAAGR